MVNLLKRLWAFIWPWYKPHKKTYSLKTVFEQEAIELAHKNTMTLRIQEQQTGQDTHRLYMRFYTPDGKRELGGLFLDIKDQVVDSIEPLQDYLKTPMKMLSDHVENELRPRL